MNNSPHSTKPSNTYKLVLLGESAVGKSSIVFRFVRSEFNEHTESTIGAAFMTQKVELEHMIVKFEIWDTAGQERYSGLAPMYYRKANAALVVYDITSIESFSKAQMWVSQLQKQLTEPGVVIALVGNKLDLVQQRSVSIEEAQEYAEKNNLYFIEVSAKTATNISELFTYVAKNMPVIESHDKSGTGINLNKDSANSDSNNKCC